jgi:hypothetical protein
LQCGTQSLDRLQAVLPRRDFQLLKRANAKLPMQLKHLVRTKPRDRQHLQDARRNLLPQGVEGWVRPISMQLSYDVGNCLSYARQLPDATRGNEVCQWFRQAEQALCGASVCAGPVGIAAAKNRALTQLVEQLRHFGGIKRAHGNFNAAGQGWCRSKCISAGVEPESPGCVGGETFPVSPPCLGTKETCSKGRLRIHPPVSVMRPSSLTTPDRRPSHLTLRNHR